VYVNGELIGEHRGPWRPVSFELPRDIVASAGGQLQLTVRVDRVRPGQQRGDDGVAHRTGDVFAGFHDVLSLQAAGLWD
ncbi:hypothetical protein, partial [Burkholderia sp. SIMBA_024]|uniref:hypothetical protein n=1 Tax=Burkholderia sp. SIMBA_024 TaxID=3085768 RepID=UPI00397D77DA